VSNVVERADVMYQPDPRWFAALAEAERRNPVWVLQIDGAPVLWSSGVPAARSSTGTKAARVVFNDDNGNFLQQISIGSVLANRTFAVSFWAKLDGTYTNGAWLTISDYQQAASPQFFQPTAFWRRFVFQATVPSASTSTTLVPWFKRYAGAVSGILFWGLQAYEIPTGETWSPPYRKTTSSTNRNLFQYSESPAVSPWSVTLATVTADYADGPASAFSSDPNPLIAGALVVNSIQGNTIYPTEGKFALGSADVEIANVGDAVSKWVGTEAAGAPRWFMQPMTLYLGEASLPEDLYQPVWSGYVTDATIKSGGSFVVRGLAKQIAWDRDVMTNCGKDDGKVKVGAIAGASTLKGNSDLSTVDGFYTGWSLKFTGGAREGEIYTVTAYTAATNQFTVTPVFAGTVASNDGFGLYNYVRITGNPINIWARLMLGDFSLSGANQTDFPLTSVTGATPTGLGMRRDDLDISQIKTQRDLWVPGYVFAIDFVKATAARKIFEEQIFRMLQGYAYQSFDGLLRVRIARPTSPLETFIELIDGYLEGLASWSRLTDKIVTRVKVWGDLNPATGDYVLLSEKTSPDARYSEDRIATTKLVEIKSDGLRTSSNGVAIADAVALRILARYGTGGPEEIQAKAGPRVAFYEPGERVFVTLSECPNIQNGSMGKTAESFEIVTAAMECKALRVTLKLQGFYPSGRPGFVAGSSEATTYAAATAENKAFAYGSTTSGPFSDGGAAYIVI
jgi:hypothetical protein